MSPRRTDDASRLTSALTGASVALGIAREATDAVPIVKQVLGAALRIVGLAEKMENDREALRTLADSSLQLAQQVRDVMQGKTPDSAIQAALERVLGALDGIETFMKQHAALSRLRRLVSYAFTVPQHVKRLSGELGDAVRDLTVVVLLATHAAVQDSVTFEGKFRILRDCEVDKLDLIGERAIGQNAIVRYHRAKVDGQLLVVRYFEGRIPQQSSSDQTPEDSNFHNIAFHDSILEEISTVHRSHPNVARIYGWSRGLGRERFTVFKSGFQPLHSVIVKCADPVTMSLNWALKLLVEMNCSCSSSTLMQDAVHHLQLMGIHWTPATPPYALDDQLQPIIGLQNDLDRTDQPVDQVVDAYSQLFHLTRPTRWVSEWQLVPAATIQKLLAGCLDERLADRLGRMETVRRDRFIVPKAEFSHRRILTDTAAEGLLRIVEHEVFDHWWPNQSWMWANILLALNKNRSHPLMRRLRVIYDAQRLEGDNIYLYGIDEDPEHIVFAAYTLHVPDEQQVELREMFGISAPSEEELLTTRLIATGTYRMLLD